MTAFPFIEAGMVATADPSLDFTVAQARQLAAELIAAADAVDKWDAEVDAYFKANPLPPLEL